MKPADTKAPMTASPGPPHAAASCGFALSSEEAAMRLVGMLDDDDVVLVKCSRGLRIELVVERLTAECS